MYASFTLENFNIETFHSDKFLHYLLENILSVSSQLELSRFKQKVECSIRFNLLHNWEAYEPT